MINCEDRLKSFKNWPIALTQKPIDMAKAGFNYCDYSDRVQSFWCGITLKDWEPRYLPWNEHKIYNPILSFCENMFSLV